jgi:predicted  nucleic acid-binding Zn-ribbon protein
VKRRHMKPLLRRLDELEDRQKNVVRNYNTFRGELARQMNRLTLDVQAWDDRMRIQWNDAVLRGGLDASDLRRLLEENRDLDRRLKAVEWVGKLAPVADEAPFPIIELLGDARGRLVALEEQLNTDREVLHELITWVKQQGEAIDELIAERAELGQAAGDAFWDYARKRAGGTPGGEE